ncbi:hypothetical protein [Pseudomonas sp. COW5]|uniref:hypothetical protein n=1 Tax=Pseudomonas sp. COW5 TaxID=2981253 RepID=UPI002247EB8C|nr:hypothetical protein [Pseudomonas sp. COW5]MCX2541541.1 hypothetical protein [Pseudomonas sp. COW5]
MNAFESNLQFIERHHQNVLQAVPILLKGTPFIFFDWGASKSRWSQPHERERALFKKATALWMSEEHERTR